MCGAIGTDDAATVNGKHDRQVLYGDVMNQLVVTALQKRRVDRDDRMQAFGRQSGAQRDRMLLGDCDIEVAIREAVGEFDQARAFTHGRGDRDQLRIGFGCLT